MKRDDNLQYDEHINKAIERICKEQKLKNIAKPLISILEQKSIGQLDRDNLHENLEILLDKLEEK